MAILASLTLFTFVATFLINLDRPYASRYAATSACSIIYGSFDNGMTVDENVPMRVMLIYVGVVTFLFVEMLIFPQSSRTVVQAYSLQFFEDLEHFLFDASKVCDSISLIHGSSLGKEEDGALSESDSLLIFREGHKEIALTTNLTETVDAVKNTVAQAKSELLPGIAEPSLGLSVCLDVAGYDNLLAEQSRILSQLDLLVTSVKSMAGHYAHLPVDHAVRSLHWPALLLASIVKIAQRLSKCADELRCVFPNGLCRPGACEISQIIIAISTFRRFEDVILAILGDVEDRHATYMKLINSSGEAVRYTPGFRLTLALAESAILSVGQNLNRCGLHLERIVQFFPIEDVK